MRLTNSARPWELEPSDINALLARNTVGRLAFARGGQIDVLPIQYVFRDGSIYGRTAAGGKLAALGSLGATVAFEVDEIHSARVWRSVLAHGTFYVLDSNSEREGWLTALQIVRRLHPDALLDDVARPERSQIFRIVVHDATGRALG